METLKLQLASESSITIFIISIFFCIVIASILQYLYYYFSEDYSNNQISKSFILITLTTFFVVFIVKSSITLSLGLVGALSIVRFRTPIKDPFELSMLFICIAIGIGLAVHAFIFVSIFAITSMSMIVLFYFIKKNDYSNLFLFNNNFFGVLEIQSKEEITNQQINDFFIKNSKKFRIISSSSINNIYNFTVLFSLDSKKLTYELVDKANSTFNKCEVIFRENV